MKRQHGTIRLLLADEHRLMRAAIRHLIETFDNMTVVAEASSEQEFLSVAAHQEVDVALVDAMVISVTGLESLARFRGLYPGIRVLVLSHYSSDSYIQQLFKAGVCGFLHRNADVQDLETAIHKAALGERFVYSAMEPETFIDVTSVIGPAATRPDRLTSRQCEVLTLVASGLRSKVIAEQLCVSAKTIDTHRADIMKRLGVNNTAGLIREGFRLGLLSSPHVTDEAS